MTRRVFISYQHADQMKARGLNLMTYNKNVNVDFTGRHLLDPVKSQDADYISRKIKEKIKGSSATIVLIGKETAQSEWVEKEIQWSKEQGAGEGNHRHTNRSRCTCARRLDGIRGRDSQLERTI